MFIGFREKSEAGSFWPPRPRMIKLDFEPVRLGLIVGRWVFEFSSSILGNRMQKQSNLSPRTLTHVFWPMRIFTRGKYLTLGGGKYHIRHQGRGREGGGGGDSLTCQISSLPPRLWKQNRSVRKFRNEKGERERDTYNIYIYIKDPRPTTIYIIIYNISIGKRKREGEIVCERERKRKWGQMWNVMNNYVKASWEFRRVVKWYGKNI